jgi:hypothetical protein
MNSNNNEDMEYVKKRKIDNKKLYKIAFIMIFLGIVFLSYNTYAKHINVTKALEFRGYKNISNLTIFRTKQVFDKKTRMRGKNYHIEFDTDTQHCQGYLRIERRGKVDSEFICKKL